MLLPTNRYPSYPWSGGVAGKGMLLADIAIRSVPPVPFLPLLGAPPATAIQADVMAATAISAVIFQNAADRARREETGRRTRSRDMRRLQRVLPDRRGERHAGGVVQASAPPSGADGHRLRQVLPARHRRGVAARGERAAGGPFGRAWWRTWNGAWSRLLPRVDIGLEQTLGVGVRRCAQDLADRARFDDPAGV